MSVTPLVKVQREDFSLEAETDRMRDGRSDIGALVTFTGLCRDEGGKLAALELEHYPGMAEEELGQLARKAIDRWDLQALTVIHRFGRIMPGENIVLVAAASAHRRAAFEAADFLMDYLKSNAPFWKKEHLRDGRTGEWVEAKAQDEQALSRWKV
ncbi:molybdenum cofactor biosynthesis protein MoaE [Nitratireductor basaltis]|uniref:Molybdopterin synthase catalytic subunit n=1 Tax=Nitratireductor basaltis TaxID=472175 RepID=A0A084UC38_9HYPH|nr:molybdenum cofactor biosynthesis protein MoaE [Nitratireductor basaltis]KFB10524.1 Molybdopterin synthase subunit MoaE [Nitratireductor basaltis]